MYCTILDKSHNIPKWFKESEAYKTTINNLYIEIDKIKIQNQEKENTFVSNEKVTTSENSYDLSKSFLENLNMVSEPTSEANQFADK